MTGGLVSDPDRDPDRDPGASPGAGPTRRAFGAQLLGLGLLAGCGGGGNGGGGGDPGPPAPARLVGEILSEPAQIASAEIRATAGYAGNVATSRAIQAAGQRNVLDLLFLFGPDTGGGRPLTRLAPDAEARLAAYVRDHPDLLVPGVRVLVVDEVFWNTTTPADTPAALQPQVDALRAAVALVRRLVPAAAVGITVTPYAAFGRPHTLEAIRQAIALVDWVGTDPYWLGDATLIPALHDWSRGFHALARQARPGVETWFIAQAFKLPAWDLATFNAFIALELVHAEQYDHIMFFGWQFASELDPASIGARFPAATKALYRKYLRVG
jgi:hypothetical protein